MYSAFETETVKSVETVIRDLHNRETTCGKESNTCGLKDAVTAEAAIYCLTEGGKYSFRDTGDTARFAAHLTF